LINRQSLTLRQQVHAHGHEHGGRQLQDDLFSLKQTRPDSVGSSASNARFVVVTTEATVKG
jgi:hypothetical protein